MGLGHIASTQRAASNIQLNAKLNFSGEGGEKLKLIWNLGLPDTRVHI